MVCNVEGQTYDDGDSMEVYRGDLVSGECDQCTCKEGKLDCHHIFHCVLNDSSCNSYIKKPDQCCPECQRGMVVGRGGRGGRGCQFSMISLEYVNYTSCILLKIREFDWSLIVAARLLSDRSHIRTSKCRKVAHEPSVTEVHIFTSTAITFSWFA